MRTSKKINQGLVKLTKKNINDGRLGEKIKSISRSDKVLTKKELIKERRKIIPDDGIGGRYLYFWLWFPFVEPYNKLRNSTFGKNLWFS